MSALETLIRVHRWQLDERRQQLGELDRLADKLRLERRRLDEEDAAEQRAAALSHEASLAYPSYAAALRDRRAKLDASIAEVDDQILRARDALAEAFQEVKRYELAASNRAKRARDALTRKQTIEQDEIAIQMHRRNRAG